MRHWRTYILWYRYISQPSGALALRVPFRQWSTDGKCWIGWNFRAAKILWSTVYAGAVAEKIRAINRWRSHLIGTTSTQRIIRQVKVLVDVDANISMIRDSKEKQRSISQSLVYKISMWFVILACLVVDDPGWKLPGHSGLLYDRGYRICELPFSTPRNPK